MEKRTGTRVHSKYPVRIFVKDEKGNLVFETPAAIVDINETGLGLKTKRPIPDGSDIGIEMEFSPTDPAILADGKVVWKAIDTKDGQQKLGVVCSGEGNPKYQNIVRKILKSSGKGCFFFTLTVFLKDTNAYGNTYFARYFEWQGQAREAFYSEFFPIDLLRSLILVTKTAVVDYAKETFFGDRVAIQVQTDNIKRASLDLVFTYRDERTGDLIATGKQTLCFRSMATKKVVGIPRVIKEIAENFAIQR